jgi:hypothetical protein
MLHEDALHHFDRFLDCIEEIVKRFPEGFRHCSLEALTHGSESVFCVIRAGVSGQTTNELLDYGKMRLQREIFSSAELRPLLDKFNSAGKLSTAYGEIGFGSRHNPLQQNFHASRSDYHPWPGWLYEMAATGHVTPGLNEPLVGKGLPPFFNPKDAITNWVQVHVGDNDSRFGRFLFFVPDFTARLDQITFAERFLQVKSTFSASDLSVSVLATDGRTTFRKTKPLQKTQRFKLMANPNSLRIFITNEQGEIVDSFAEQEAWTTRERIIFAGARYPNEAMELIRRGESDTVEFKPYVRLDDVKKAAELVKAVISFANTRGGTIFVGVTDDAEILGVEAHMPHDSKKAASFEADFFTAVRNLLKQKLNRIPAIDTRSERIGDKTLFVLQVAEGTAKPYTNIQTRETFVRRGASDMRPDPDTELRQMLGSSGNPLTFI